MISPETKLKEIEKVLKSQDYTMEVKLVRISIIVRDENWTIKEEK